MDITVWRCTDACGNYYASSSMRTPLNEGRNHKSSMTNREGETAFQFTGTRDRCPDCGATREPVAVTVPGVEVPQAA